MADDDSGANARLVVAFQVQLDQLRKAFVEAGKAADGALLGIENRTKRTQDRLNQNLELIRLNQQLDLARASGAKATVDQLTRELQIRQQSLALVRAGVTAEQARAQATAHVNAVAAAKEGAPGGVNRSEMMELAHVARSAFDALAAGANPLRVLAVEGGRVTQAFANAPGGFGGALTGIIGLVNPAVVGFIALAAVTAALTAAETSFESEHRKTLIALLGTAAASGLTVQGLEDIVTATEKVNHQSETTNRALVTMFAGAGVEGADNIKAATALVEDFAVSTGEKVPEAADKLASALRAPAEGVKALNEQVRGFVSGDQMRLIEQLAETGHQAEAQKIMLDALAQAVSGNADQMTGLAKALRDVSNWFHNAETAAGGFIAKMMGYHGIDELPELKQRRAQLQATVKNGGGDYSPGDGQAQADLDQLNAVISKLEAQQKQVTDRDTKAQDNVKSQHLESLIENGDPSRAKIERLSQDLKDLTAALKDAKAKGLPTDRIQSAITGTQVQLARAERRETHIPGERGSQNDETGEKDSSAKEKLDEATKAAADAMAKLATSIDARAAAEKASVQSDTAKKLQELDAEEAQIRKAKIDSHKAAQIALLQQAKTEVQNAEAAKLELIERNRQIATLQAADASAQDAAKLRQQAYSQEEQYATAMASLASSTDKRQAFERQALAARQARETDQAATAVTSAQSGLQAAVLGGDQEKIASAATNVISAQNAQAALPQQQQLQAQQLGQQQLSPWQQWEKQGQQASANVGQVLQSEAVKGMDAFNEGLARAIVSGKSMGDVFKSVFREMETDLINYLLKQAELGVFGGSSAAGGGGLLGSIMHLIPGFASGTDSAPGGWSLVGENGPELVNLNRGSQVVPNGTLKALANSSRRATSAGTANVVHQHFNVDARGSLGFEEYNAALNAKIQHASATAAQAGASGGHQMTMQALKDQRRYSLR